MKKKVPVGLLIGLLVITAVAAFNVSYIILWNAFSSRVENLNAREAAFYKLSEIAAYIDEYYVGDASESRRADGAIDGYVSALSDYGTYYFSAGEAVKYLKSDELNYTGIGIISCYDEVLSGIRIIGMYEGSTAAEAGLQYLDVITRVNGEAVAYLGYETAVEHIRGEEGTDIKLTVYRETAGAYFELYVRRGAVITERELKYEMLDGELGYIKLDNFDTGTDAAFKSAYAELEQQGMCGLIIDLRMNPGGYMDVMSSIADELMGEGEIYSEKRMDGEDSTVYANGEATNTPVVLIVNEYTLSAAEYFAAALQQSGVAKVVGIQTYGSGYAQSTINFADGSVLVLSTTEYFTPEGYSLNGEGLTPDYTVKMSTSDLIGAINGTKDDLQLVAATCKFD